MPDSKDDQLQAITGPNIAELRKEFRRSYTDERITFRVRESDETRFATWTGQSRDGRKHAKDLGRQAFPWEGASDTRIRLADELCNFQVNLATTAVSRSALNVEGIESGDNEDAQAIAVYLRWMTGSLISPEWEKELELHSEYSAQYGWSVLHTAWERCYARVPRRITLKSLAGFLGIRSSNQFDALSDALTRDGQLEMFADILAGSNPGLTRKKALKHLKEIAKNGETTFEVPQQSKNQVKITALRPYYEVLFPPETGEWQRARAIFRRDYYTIAELEEKAASGDWDDKWVEEVKRTAGQNSQVWDYGLSPVLGETERIEERQNLVEVVHGYSRRVTDDGTPGIYLTTFSPYMDTDGRNNELFAEHRLVTEAQNTYPFEVFTREMTRRSPIESRGISEIVRTWQTEYKAQADQVFDRSSFDTIPPLKVPLRYGQRLKIGPGVQVPEQRPGDIDWMQPPDRGAELAFELMKQVERRCDRYFGRPNEDIPVVETQMIQQAFVTRWLRHLGTVSRRIWELAQRFESDERFGEVTGTGRPIPRDPGRHNFKLHFDVREMDGEYVDRKLQAISQWILPEDTMGIVNRTELLRMKLQVIDPTLPQKLIVEHAEASQKMFNEVNQQVALMALGNQPQFVENDPSAGIKAQFLQQIIGNNPKYQELLRKDEQFKALVEAFIKNLSMSQMQQQNKVVGRIGVNPNQQTA